MWLKELDRVYPGWDGVGIERWQCRQKEGLGCMCWMGMKTLGMVRIPRPNINLWNLFILGLCIVSRQRQSGGFRRHQPNYNGNRTQNRWEPYGRPMFLSWTQAWCSVRVDIVVHCAPCFNSCWKCFGIVRIYKNHTQENYIQALG